MGPSPTAQAAEIARLRREVDRVKMVRDILKRASLIVGQAAEVGYGFIRSNVADFPLQLMCVVLEVSRSGYYAWISRAESARAPADQTLAAEIRSSHEASRGRY